MQVNANRLGYLAVTQGHVNFIADHLCYAKWH